MTLESLFQSIEATPLSVAMQESAFLFPIVESIHVVGLTLVVGSIAAIDLRLLWVSARGHAVSRMSAELLPWTWGAFAITVLSGLLLFATRAADYVTNVAFLIKMGLIVAAGLNMMIFHFITWRRVHHWDTSSPPRAAKLAGGLSLAFWVLVVVFGRIIGFL